LRRPDASAIIATVVLFVVFSTATSNFFTPFNQFNVWRAASQNVFTALGQAMVVLVGGMNLSLGASEARGGFPLAGLEAVRQIERYRWPSPDDFD
jgi:ribose transport system permease protein